MSQASEVQIRFTHDADNSQWPASIGSGLANPVLAGMIAKASAGDNSAKEQLRGVIALIVKGTRHGTGFKVDFFNALPKELAKEFLSAHDAEKKLRAAAGKNHIGNNVDLLTEKK